MGFTSGRSFLGGRLADRDFDARGEPGESFRLGRAWSGYSPLHPMRVTPVPDVYIRTTSIPASADPNGQYSVRLRLDDGQPFTQHWDQSINHDSLFAPQPVDLAQKLGFAKRLTLEYTPSGSGTVATSFDLDGLAGGLGKLADACGWSLQSLPRRPPKSKRARRTFVRSERFFWIPIGRSNNEAVARKARAVETHTCLQVVNTSEAADAILGWSIRDSPAAHFSYGARTERSSGPGAVVL